jgi:putative phage-type endonuclease
MLTDKQKAARKKGIGASESAIVMGLNPNISPYQLWRIKTGRDEAQDLSNVPQVYWGSMHEENIANHYAKIMECEVKEVPETLYHKEHPFILCHLDREVIGQSKILECKFAMFARDDWGQSGSDIVPLTYIIQVQHQLAVTGYEKGDLAVLIGGYDYRIYNFERDEQLIKKIIEEITEFWKCVENDTPPPLRDRIDAALQYSNPNGNLIDAAPEIIDVVDKFIEVRSKTKELEEEKEKLSNILTLFIKDADGIKTENGVLATWKKTVKGNRVLKVMEAR